MRILKMKIGSIKIDVVCFLRWFKYALKGQKLPAQGIALGITAVSKTPCKGKSFQTQGIKTAMGFRYPYRNPIVILV